MYVIDLFKKVDIEEFIKKFIVYDRKKRIVDDISDFQYDKDIRLVFKEILSLKPIYSDDYLFVRMNYEIKEDDFNEKILMASIVEKNDVLQKQDNIYFLRDNCNDLSKYEVFNMLPTFYGVLGFKREKVLGLNFCEHILEKYDLVDVLIAIYRELTIFGLSNEKHEKNMKDEFEKMDESVKQAKEHPETCRDFDEVMLELFGDEWEKYEYIPPTKSEICNYLKKTIISETDELLWILEKCEK